MMLRQPSLWTGLCAIAWVLASCTQFSPLATLVSNRPDGAVKQVKFAQPVVTTSTTIAALPTLQPQWDFQLPALTACPQPIADKVSFRRLAPQSSESLRDSIVLFAKQYLGRPYRHAGQSARGFDCSGFTSFVMSRFGYSLPRSSASQAVFGTPIPIEEARKGDLIFFGNKDRRGKMRVNHAALVISEEGEELMMIHAARRGITIDNVKNVNWESYYGRRLVGARRIIHDSPLPSTEELFDLLAASANPEADTVHQQAQGFH